ncbi:MAG: glycosyltransferase [Myxococcota bacterium]
MPVKRDCLQMVGTPAVSVLLPVRDAEVTLEAAVRSVLASEGADLELICVDDRSKDGTPALLRGFARRDPRVRVLDAPRRGLVAALNRGLAQARAACVARMDADDEMHPRRLARQLEFLARHPQVALVGCRVESFRSGGLAEGYRIYTDWVNALVEEGEIRREALVECPVPHPTWMFRSRIVLGLGGYRERPWPEDLDLLYRLLATGRRVAKLPEVLHRWRDHPGRLSRVDPRYGRPAFARAKAHWIGRLRPMRAAVLWGAGRTGRRFSRLLAAEGIPTRAFVDIHPGRTGSAWRGIPVLSTRDLDARVSEWQAEGVPVLGAVASRGARGEIRAHLRGLGLREGSDFLMVA